MPLPRNYPPIVVEAEEKISALRTKCWEAHEKGQPDGILAKQLVDAVEEADRLTVNQFSYPTNEFAILSQDVERGSYCAKKGTLFSIFRYGNGEVSRLTQASGREIEAGKGTTHFFNAVVRACDPIEPKDIPANLRREFLAFRLQKGGFDFPANNLATVLLALLEKGKISSQVVDQLCTVGSDWENSEELLKRILEVLT